MVPITTRRPRGRECIPAPTTRCGVVSTATVPSDRSLSLPSHLQEPLPRNGFRLRPPALFSGLSGRTTSLPLSPSAFARNGAVGTSCSACTLSSQCPSNQTCLSQPASLLTHSNATLFCRSEPHGLLSSYLGEHRLELAREGDRVELLVSSSLVELQPQLLRCEYAHCEVGV